MHYQGCVPRDIPKIKGWTATLLKQHEDNESKEKDFNLAMLQDSMSRMKWAMERGEECGCCSCYWQQDEDDIGSMRGVWDAT